VALLEVRELNTYYGKIHALQGVSLHLEAGETVTLVGANGAGKSTLLKTVSGLIAPASGSILLDGEELGRLKPHHIVRRGVVQVPEGRRILGRLTVQENLIVGAYARPDRSQVDGDLEMVYATFPRLRERRGQSGGTLSGGEQQMLAIGRGLMARPRVLLLDEPSMGLAPILVEEIFAIIRRLAVEQGTTILLVEQNAQAALTAAERGYVLETGRIRLTGTAAELLGHPDVRRAYLGG
jgi:branched-chain amino acid transport system ATP-binding protein